MIDSSLCFSVILVVEENGRVVEKTNLEIGNHIYYAKYSGKGVGGMNSLEIMKK